MHRQRCTEAPQRPVSVLSCCRLCCTPPSRHRIPLEELCQKTYAADLSPRRSCSLPLYRIGTPESGHPQAGEACPFLVFPYRIAFNSFASRTAHGIQCRSPTAAAWYQMTRYTMIWSAWRPTQWTAPGPDMGGDIPVLQGECNKVLLFPDYRKKPQLFDPSG